MQALRGVERWRRSQSGLGSAATLATMVVLCAAWPSQAIGAPTAASSVADAMGNMHVPANYRHSYEYLGSWAIASEKTAGSKQIHMVYASPGSTAAMMRTGKFPANSVLVKEVFEGVSDSMTTGPVVSRAGQLQGWFVMIKGQNGTHPENPLWGDGRAGRGSTRTTRRPPHRKATRLTARLPPSRVGDGPGLHPGESRP